MLIRQSFFFSLVSGLLFVSHSHAVTKVKFEHPLIDVRVATNAPQPIGAFYEGRGFQKNMIDILKQQCFVSVFIKNKSNDIVWLDLSQWRFSNADGKINRLDRHYWKSRWQDMNIPLAHQSTFRWTLLPEELDFYPKEKEGGNIILPRHDKPFNFSARFFVGRDKKATPIDLNFNDITCATEQP